MIIVYHVILQDHVIKGSCDFMDRSPSKSYHPAKFGVHKHSFTLSRDLDVMTSPSSV